MDAYPQFEVDLRTMSNLEGLHIFEQVERRRGDLGRVLLLVPEREPGDEHVGVTDGLHLVDIVVADDLVEERVEVVQHIDHLFINGTCA